MNSPKQSLSVATLVLLACCGSAYALDDVAAAKRDLWCGLALDLVVDERPSDSAIDTATLERLTAGAEGLIRRGEAAYLELGYSDAALALERETLAQRVASELGTAAEDEPFSYEECRALID